MTAQTTEQPTDWMKPTANLANIIAKGDPEAPLIFLLGAGCSISSGCPSYDEVGIELDAVPSRDPRDTLDRPTTPEVQSRHIRPLFTDTSPNIGYYCLAALARERRVVVLNLNWDDMVVQAASALGVECASHDIVGISNDDVSRFAESHSGLTVIHLHGLLEAPRFGRTETAAFTNEQIELVEHICHQGTLVCVGASLLGEVDANSLLQALGHAQCDGYYFSLGPENSSDTLVRAVQFAPLFANKHWITPDFDYDRFMLILLGSVRKRTYEIFCREEDRQPFDIPVLERSVFPEPHITRLALKNLREFRVVMVVGPPKAGKFILCNILAYLISLCVPRTRRHSRVFEGPGNTCAAIGSPTATDDTASFLLRYPFGMPPEYADPNPTLLILLRQYARQTGASTTCRVPILVCCEPTQHICDEGQNAPFVVEFQSGDSWYSKESLTAVARNLPVESGPVLAAIERGDIVTPHQIDRSKLDVKSRRLDVGREIEYYTQRLHEDGDLALQCCIFRLEHFGRFSQTFLVPDRHLLKKFQFENQDVWRFVSLEVEEAVDRYIDENLDLVLDQLESSWHMSQDDTNDIRRLWVLAKPSTGGCPRPVVQLDMPSNPPSFLLARCRDNSLIESAIDACSDEWALTDVCYQVVRLWPDLQPNHRHYYLDRIAGRTDQRGLYALLEAALYFANGTADTIWHFVLYELQKRLDTGGLTEELCLCADAALWRDTPWVQRWLDGALKAISGDDQFGGLLAFEAAYHPEGFQESDRRLSLSSSLTWTDEKRENVARFVRWHFAHQAHGRKVLPHFRPADKEFLCRTHYPSLDLPANKERVNLVRALGTKPSTAGWGFHAGCRWLRGRPEDEPLANEMRSCLKQAADKDCGVITGVLSYNSSKIFDEDLSDYLERPGNRRRMFEILVDGYNFDGREIRPGRFDLCTNPSELHQRLHLDYSRLTKAGIPWTDWPEFCASVRKAARVLTDGNRDLTAEKIWRQIRRLVAGDLDLINKTVVARGSTDHALEDADSALAHAIEVACLEDPSGVQTRLPL